MEFLYMGNCLLFNKMEVKTIDECFKFRLLRKIEPSKEKSDKSLELANNDLKEADNALKKGIFKYVIISSYMAMFHAARAVLYLDGIQEKSHYAVFIYLKEKYSNKISIGTLNLLNIHRTERHEAVYGFDFEPNKEDAKTALEDGGRFLKEIKELLLERKR